MKNNKVLIIFSFLFGIAYSTADQLSKNNQLAFSLIQCIVAGLLYGIIVIHVSISSIKFSYIVYPQNLVKKYWIFLGTLIAIYFICLFTYFPGVGMNDSLNIMKYGMEITNQFPVFYCAFITILTRIGRYLGTLQISIALYSVIQMIVVCSICAGIITWFWSKPIFKPLKYGVLIFYTLERV